MPKILIVDDNVVCRTIVSLLLTQQGHKITLAEDGKKALDCLRSNKFDLIILDHLMPDISGLDVLRLLRKDDAMNHECCPVIVISGGFTSEERAEYETLGVVDIHQKPADPKYLCDQVSRLFPKPKEKVKMEIRHLTLIGSRNAPFYDFLRKQLPPEDAIVQLRAEQFNSGGAVLDHNAINLVQFAEDLTPAGQKLLEEKMIGIKVVLCTTSTIDQLEDSGFRTALIFRFGVRSLRVPDNPV
jgi:CheY-like chemotaxis protein